MEKVTDKVLHKREERLCLLKNSLKTEEGFLLLLWFIGLFGFIVSALIFKCCWEIEVDYKGNRRAIQ